MDVASLRHAALIEKIRDTGVHDERLLYAFQQIDRADFVAPDCRGRSYEDVPLPIPHDQVTTQPSLVATMVQALRLTPRDRVLEIGTGLGYQAAILSRLCHAVATIERFPDIAALAEQNLSRRMLRNVLVLVGDGTRGAPRHAPFDGIIGAAAVPGIPPPLAAQLQEGGRLVLPIGPSGAEDVQLFTKRSGRLRLERQIALAHFVPMVGEFGVREPRPRA